MVYSMKKLIRLLLPFHHVNEKFFLGSECFVIINKYNSFIETQYLSVKFDIRASREISTFLDQSLNKEK